MDGFKALFAGMICAFILAIGGSIAYTIAYYNHSNEYVVKVEDKFIKSASDDSQKYLFDVKTKNGEEKILEDTDLLLGGKFNSSNVYVGMKKGQTYKVKTLGWRIPFLSEYENIVSYEEVK